MCVKQGSNVAGQISQAGVRGNRKVKVKIQRDPRAFISKSKPLCQMPPESSVFSSMQCTPKFLERVEKSKATTGEWVS